jgi:flagellar motility protein MotE (MotC chaperone)
LLRLKAGKSANAMKFVLKILIFLVAAVANLGIYVFLFLTMSGLSPQQSMEIIKIKMEQVAADTASTASQQPDSASTARPDESQKIADEMAELQKQKAELNSEKASLEALRNEVSRLLAQKNKADDEKMYKLAKIYDGMDQQRLAEVFSQMDDSLVIKILPKMKAANASQVMQYLPPQRSATISRMILKGS